MRQCPFCGTDESQTTQLFCHRCHNQIRAELSGEIFSFPDIAGYNNLVKVYGLIFADVPQFSFAKQIILQSLNKHDNFEGMPSDKKVVAEKALNWANKLCDWQVSFDPLGKPTNLSYAENADIYKDIEDTADGDLGHGINAAIEKIRVEIGDDGFAVRALNLCQGCTIKIAGSPKIESDSVMAIEGHAKELKSDVPMIFISAPSYYSQSGDKSVEYAVGKALKYQLDTKGIKAFWWENFNKDTNILGRPIDKQISDLRIAPKIAFGLAFSSIFIGLAFNAENYSQNENCKYETKHFVDFKYSDTEKEYVSFSSAPKDFKDIQRINSLLYSKLPKNRTIRLLTLNEKFTDYPDKLKELFPQNFAGSEAINVDCNACNGTVDAYVKKALEVILNILQHDYYKTVYKPLKDKNGFDSNEEFKNWFCMPTGDVGAFHEIVNAPTNYNCSYAVLDEFGADVHDKIEFFVERANYWDDNEGEAKRIIRLNMVVRETNDKYMASRQLARMANENDPSIAEKCGFLFAEDENQYQQCEVNYQDREAAVKPIVFRFSDYTKSGGKYCIVKDINNLNSGIIGTIKFQSFSGAIKVYNFAVTLARQIVKIPKKAKHKEGRLYDKVKRKIHCPYCAEPLPRFTAKIKWAQSKTGISCLGEECNQAKFGLRKGRILCTQNVQSEYAFALPEGYEKGKSAFITMMGLRDAGKSVFISKLFEVEKNKIDFANSDSSAYQKDEIVVESVQLSDNYIKYALSPYVESVSCYFPRAIEGAEDILTDQLWRKQYLIKESGNGTVGIFADYCSIPYANFVLKTRGDDDVCATLHYAPLMLKLKTHDGLENYFSFYDLPGEEIEKVAKNVKTQISALKEQAKTDEKIRNTLKNIMLLQNSNGIILLVNAGANVNDENKGVEPICNILTKFLEHKDSETENDANNKKDKKLKQVKNVALAVVLCQFDRIEHEFDYDSIVRTLAPLEDADFYKGSEIEEYINACSLEVKDYLKKSGYSRLVGIIDNFAYHKYFAVSAIGHQDSIKDDDDEKKRAITRFISNPRGIDNILIWLAYQMGMIDYLEARRQELIRRMQAAMDEDDEDSDDEADDDDDEEIDEEELRFKALKLCIERNVVSVSMFQRSFPIGYLRSCKLIEWMEGKGYVSIAVGSQPRRVLITKEQFDKLYSEPHLIDEDDDDDDLNIEAKFAEYEKFLEQHFSDDDNDGEDEEDEVYDNIINRIFHSDADEDEVPGNDSVKHKQAMQNLVSVLSKIADKKKAPINADEMPLHPSWDNEDEFADVVMERMEHLIKSDKRMGQQGAVKKAETYLEAVRDTHDRKMVQVYERLVYEIKNTSNYLYGQLKKQFFGE